MSKTFQGSQKERKWSKLKGWSLKILLSLVKSTIVRTIAGIILSAPILKKILEWIFGLSIKALMTYPLTERIIPINSLSILLTILLIGSLVYLGHKIRDFKERKIRYIDHIFAYWRVKKTKRGWDLTPCCLFDANPLKRIGSEFNGYSYRCQSCDKKYDYLAITDYTATLRNRLESFGLKHYTNRFVNIKEIVKPVKPR